MGTEDGTGLAHIDVDVRVVLRWRLPDVFAFPDPDADFRDAAVVPELEIAAAGHRRRPPSFAESGFASERIGSRYEPRLMRLFLRSRHPLIGLRSRNDGSLARCGASSGDLRVMRL